MMTMMIITTAIKMMRMMKMTTTERWRKSQTSNIRTAPQPQRESNFRSREARIESKRHDARSERRQKHDLVTLDSNIKINQNHRDAKPTSGHLELNEPTQQRRAEQVLEQQNTIHEIGKMLKIIVNGTAVLQYVLIESLTPPQFYSMSPI